MASRANDIGFIFTPESKRTVSARQVGDWLRVVGRPNGKRLVAVFADDSLAVIERIVRELPIDVVQLHGHESPEAAAAVRRRTGKVVWKAVRHGDRSLEIMRTYAGIADGYVVDTKVRGQLGGTGLTFDWTAVPAYMNEARRLGAICLIAGGICPENIDRLLSYRPMGIDIASGIETNGRKDKQQIEKIEQRVWMNHDRTVTDGRDGAKRAIR